MFNEGEVGYYFPLLIYTYDNIRKNCRQYQKSIETTFD